MQNRIVAGAVAEDEGPFELSLRPRTLAELAAVPGAGEVKLARYGEAFLTVINEHDVRAG